MLLKIQLLLWHPKQLKHLKIMHPVRLTFAQITQCVIALGPAEAHRHGTKRNVCLYEQHGPCVLRNIPTPNLTLKFYSNWQTGTPTWEAEQEIIVNE